MTEIRLTGSGVRLRAFPGWPGRIFDVAIDWRTGRALPEGFRETRPQGDRRKRPSKRPAIRKRIIEAAEAQCGHGTGFAMVDLIVASRPEPRGTHNTAERAETVAMVYSAALAQGLSPLKALSAAYGFDVDTSGKIGEYSTTVKRWVRCEARKLGFLPEKHAPQRWPGRGGHPLEPRRAPSMLQEPKCEGPYVGRTLTLHYRPIPPLGVNAAGEEVADVEFVGRWSDGKPLDDHIEPLRAVTLVETVTKHLLRLNTKFETRYPGARVQSTSAVPEPLHPAAD